MPGRDDEKTPSEASVIALPRKKRVGRPPGIPASEAQRAAGRKNLAKGQEVNRRLGQIERDPNYVTRAQRFKNGTLTVDELTDQEVQEMRFMDRHGDMRGTPPRLTVAQERALKAEWHKRMMKGLEAATNSALNRLATIATSPEYEPRDALRAIEMLTNRSLGKVAETLNIQAGANWDEAMDTAQVDVSREDIG